MKTAVPPIVLALVAISKLPILPNFQLLYMVLPVALYGLKFVNLRALCAFTLAIVYALTSAQLRLEHRLPAQLDGETVRAIGQVASLPERRDGIEKFRFQVQKILDYPDSWSGLVKVSRYYPVDQLDPGDKVTLTVKLSRPSASFNAGLFDYEGWIFSQGIAAIGYVKDRRAGLIEHHPLTVPHHALRQWIRARMQSTFQESLGHDLCGLLIALAIGETAQISTASWRILSLTGTNHLLIISGLHVGMVAGLVFKLLGSTRLSIRQVALVTIAFTFAYAGIAGFGLPVQRALMMTVTVLGSVCLSRSVTPFNLLMISMFGVLLLQPFSILSIGFWLSFGAVFSLLYAFVGRVPTVEKKPIAHLLLTGIRTQWVVFVMMFPVLMYLLFQLSLIAFFANLIAIPVISLVVVPLLLCFILLSLIGVSVANYPLDLAAIVLRHLWQLLAWLADKELVFHGVAISWFVCAIAFIGVLILFTPKGLLPRWLGLFCLMPMFSNKPALTEGELQFTFIDVGQGLSVLVRTATHVLLYDTGPSFGSRFNSGEQIITPLLRRQGIGHLDALVVSHSDNDHAGGMVAVQRNFSIKRVISYQGIAAPDSEVCESNPVWQLDNIRFEVFSIDPESSIGNNRSCLLLVQTAGFTALLTGDIEAAAEQRLTNKRLIKTNLISAPHHGSRTSSTLAFVNSTLPGIVIVSSGFKNHFGHPDTAVVNRYERRHARVLNTANQGAITVTIKGSAITKISGARSSQRKFWHRPVSETEKEALIP